MIFFYFRFLLNMLKCVIIVMFKRNFVEIF